MKYVGLCLVILALFSGCAPKAGPSYPTAKAAADAAFRCLETSDAECLVAFSTSAEAAKTGLTPDVIRQVVKKVAPEFSKMKREGEMEFEGNPTGLSWRMQTYLNSAGAKVYLNAFVVKSPDGFRLNSMSWLMSDVMNASEVRSGQNYSIFMLRGMTRNQAWYESVGWKGMLASSELEDFKTWDEMKAKFETQIKQQKAKPSGKG